MRRQRGCGTRLPGTPPGASSGVCRHSRQCSSDCQHGRGGTSQHGTSPRATRWVLSEAWGGRRRWGRAGFRRAEGACATEGRHSGCPGRSHRTPGHCPVCRLPAAGLEAPSGPLHPQTQGWTEGVGEGGVKQPGPGEACPSPRSGPSSASPAGPLSLWTRPHAPQLGTKHLLETAQPPGGALGSERGPQAHSERSHLAWCVPTGDGALALTQAPPPPRQPLTAAHGLHGLFPSAGLRHDRREQLLRVLVLAEGLVLASRCGPRAGRTRWASVRTVDRGQPRLDEAVTVTDPKSTGGRHGAVRATGSRTASRRTLDLHARLVGTPVDVLTGEAELGLRVQWL